MKSIDLIVDGVGDDATLVAESDVSLSISLDQGAAFYEGPYAVVPSFEHQGLDTEGKRMRHDVDVTPIPIATVGNPSGGYTCTIG